MSHTVLQMGEPPAHQEWRNVDDVWPNQTFAETLRAAIGDEGAVLTRSSFEKSALKDIESEMRTFRAHRRICWIGCEL